MEWPSTSRWMEKCSVERDRLSSPSILAATDLLKPFHQSIGTSKSQLYRVRVRLREMLRGGESKQLGRGISNFSAFPGQPLTLDQHKVPLSSFDPFAETAMLGRRGSCSFGLRWKDLRAAFPQYFRQYGKIMVAVLASAYGNGASNPILRACRSGPGLHFSLRAEQLPDETGT